ncbi:MAG: glutamate synthase large subunit [Myxococcales bacterium]|nr:glutamate synthase large subunit [Myxococcales bacterium]
METMHGKGFHTARGKERLAREAEARGLYRSQMEKDACGVAFVAHQRGTRSHGILTDALDALANMAHRGAVGSDPLTGDGSGVLLQIPDRFLRDETERLGIPLPAPGDYAVGQFFLPGDAWTHPPLFGLIERIAKEEGLRILGWRSVPVEPAHVGPLGREAMPHIRQLFLGRAEGQEPAEFGWKLYVARKRIEREVRTHMREASARADAFYICSFSPRTIVYKGLLLPERLAQFYPDLADERVETALALVHQRFSTNTLPSWERAHPYRHMAHNGEINTLRGNINAMRARERMLDSSQFGRDVDKLVPILDPTGSDSAMFDNCLELLMQNGRSLPHSMMMMIPEAWQHDTTMPKEKREFYEYHASMMEPWDGPACIAFTDGRQIGAMLDRNGLRPARYVVTADDRVILSSEAGVLDLDPKDIVQYGRLRPGHLLLVDLEAQRIVDDAEIKAQVTGQQPYGAWLDETLVRIEDLPAPNPQEIPPGLTGPALDDAQLTFGYTEEDLSMLVTPMASTGKEPVGAMGDDTPLAVLSDHPQLLFNYFKQLFAQVTNPPIDPLREGLVMSLRVTLGPWANLFEESSQQCRQLALPSPILTRERMQQVRTLADPRLRAKTLSTVYRPDASRTLKDAIRDLRHRAEDAARSGAGILILSDRDAGPAQMPIPSLLALGAVHHHLIRAGLRQRVAIVVESGEVREVMHFCLLLGYGAGAVHPYLAFDSVTALVDEGLIHGADEPKAIARYVEAVEAGLLKTLSKMGISTLQSYRGAQIFEAVGLAQSVIDEFFPDTPSRIDGIDLDTIELEAKKRHDIAHKPPLSGEFRLPSGSHYRWRRGGEYHAYNPNTVALLQHGVRSADYKTFKKYSAKVNEEARAIHALRALFTFTPREAIAIEEVEPAIEIVKRFRTGAMSFGSLSKEAHETIAVAMNRLGARSNSGEGGEEPERYRPDENGDSRRSAIKQIASGRFGVTAEYLLQADEIQIKMAQGAKPGEGGQLPGHKVDELIAKTRFSVPGVDLISPPPHHDIYSIEDLAQLIYDMRCVNPKAEISVKLVSEVGVGTVAAGVTKAKADTILISGHSGGTGASPLSSIKHAGVPWEMGLAEAQQTLVLNGLRDRVRLEVDGQLKTGRDVVMGALLGAEGFGFGTAALVSAGCVLMRVCHKNTCPVGIATQDPALRKHFRGQPDHVMNFMVFVAEETREIMASLGFRTFEEMIGRSDILRPRTDISHWKADKVRLDTILHSAPPELPRRKLRNQNLEGDEPLDVTWRGQLANAIESKAPSTITDRVRNRHRTVGARLASTITERWGSEGLPEGTVRVRLTGVAGQSFAAFTVPGMVMELTGVANDSVAKGMSGGRVVIRLPDIQVENAEINASVGNVALYGATGGEAFIHGMAGERFAVRNSGATAVVEGVGDHGCEYMTRGTVLVLGEIGRNFGAGMSGGVAYLLETVGFRDRINGKMVDVVPADEEDLETIHRLIVAHQKATNSATAARLLASWNSDPSPFWKVIPREYRRILETTRKTELRVVS